MNAREFIREARAILRETWDELIRSNRTNGKMPRRKTAQLPSTTRSRVPQLRPSASKKAVRLGVGFTRILLVEAEGLHAGLERATTGILRRLKEWENRFILRRLDGLLEHLDLDIVEGNLVRDPKSDWTFAVSKLEPGLELRESAETINALYAARCPVQRIDVGLRGVAGVKEYTQWLETEVALHGKPRHGLMEGLRSVIKTIQHDQLAWQSYLVYPVYKMPSELEGVLSEKRFSSDDLHRYLLSLFHPVSDFDLREWMRFKTRVGLGLDAVTSLLPKNLARELAEADRSKRTHLYPGLETSQKVSWQLVQIKSLGVIPRTEHQANFEDIAVSNWDNPELLPLLRTRTLEELRRRLLPLIEEEGQEIRLVTTVMPVRPDHRSSVLNMHRIATEDIEKLADRALKREGGITDAALGHRLMLLKAIESITGAGYKPLHGSVVLAVRGNKPEQTSAIQGRVQNLLQELSISVEEPSHRAAHWQLYRALMPTIRTRETSKNVFLYPSDQAKQILRVTQRPPIREGVFLGRILETFVDGGDGDIEPVVCDEPFVAKLGGNSVYCGTSGSGKSMGAKLEADQVLAMNKHLFGRIMDNTEAATLETAQLRGWKGLVEGYSGVIVEARKFEAEKKLRNHLDELTAEKKRLVLFVSYDVRPEFDEVYLRWLLQDIQRNNPGISVVDECANWFKYQEDPRGGLYVDHLLNQFTGNSYRSITTIQVLGAIRETIAHKGTYRMLMGMAQAGVYVYYTPDAGSLEWDLNINTGVYPRLLSYIVSRVDSFKTDPTGPVDKPGYGVLYSPGRAALFKMETDEATLRLFARKDPEAHEAIWGL